MNETTANSKPVMSKRTYTILMFTRPFIAGILMLFLFMSNILVSYVPSESMYPTLKINSVALIGHVAEENIKYDDIITFFPSMIDDEEASAGSILESFFIAHIKHQNMYIKRVVGLPGDTIAVHDKYLWRNGEKIESEYIMSTTDGFFDEITVPEHCFFCMGDNRNYSNDSRVIGCVPYRAVAGRVFLHIPPIADHHNERMG